MIKAETIRRQARVKELKEKLRTCQDLEEKDYINSQLIIENQNRLKTTRQLDNLVFKI